MNTPKIHWIVEIFSTKTDRNGNSYHAAIVTNCANGKNTKGMIDGVSNLENAAPTSPGASDNYSRSHVHFSYHTSHSFRAMNRLFKDKYLMESAKSMAAQIVKETL